MRKPNRRRARLSTSTADRTVDRSQAKPALPLDTDIISSVTLSRIFFARDPAAINAATMAIGVPISSSPPIAGKNIAAR